MVVDYSFLQYYLILLLVSLVGAVRIDAAKAKEWLTFCAGTRWRKKREGRTEKSDRSTDKCISLIWHLCKLYKSWYYIFYIMIWYSHCFTKSSGGVTTGVHDLPPIDTIMHSHYQHMAWTLWILLTRDTFRQYTLLCKTKYIGCIASFRYW